MGGLVGLRAADGGEQPVELAAEPRRAGLPGRPTGRQRPGGQLVEFLGCRGELRIGHGEAQQMLRRIERDRRLLLPQHERLVHETVEFRVTLIECEDRGAGFLRVGHSVKEAFWRDLRAYYQQRLSAAGLLEALEPDREMRRSTRRRRPADQGRHQARQLGKPAFVGQVRGHVPGFLRRGTDDEQSLRGAGPVAQRAGEGSGPIEPASGREQCSQRLDLSCLHRSMLPEG